MVWCGGGARCGACRLSHLFATSRWRHLCSGCHVYSFLACSRDTCFVESLRPVLESTGIAEKRRCVMEGRGGNRTTGLAKRGFTFPEGWRWCTTSCKATCRRITKGLQTCYFQQVTLFALSLYQGLPSSG